MVWCGVVVRTMRVEVVEDRRDLLDPAPFEFYNESTSKFGRRMVVR